jgi:hypothetical protein
MANIRISQLPTAPTAITGSELIPIVQNGETVQTTVSAIINSPVQTQTFLTKNNEPTLPNSRYLAVGSGLSLVDGGAQSTYQIALNGAIANLNALSNGIVTKTGTSTLVNRSIAISGNGLAVSNGDGVSGNPTISVINNLANLAGASGTGILAIAGTGTLNILSLTGTSNQISVANPDGSTGNPTISLANNPVLPGAGSVTLPTGNTAARSSPVAGMMRYNSETGVFEGYSAGTWGAFTTGTGVSSFSAGSTGLTPNSATLGGIVLAGTLNVANGGTGITTTPANGALLIGNGTGYTSATLTAGANITITNTAGGISITANTTGATTYLGTWNASTNTPTLASGVGTNGGYYIVSVAGTTTLNGISLWSVGDWAVFNGTVWQKVLGSSSEAFQSITVTGLTGYMYGNGTSAVTASTTIPNTAITGLGTMSTQNANSVAITGGTVNGTSIGATTASTGAFTYLSTSSTTSTTPTLGFNASNCNFASGATVSGSYFQAVLQNKSGTAGASVNYVLSNDLGTDSTYYGEFGMNSSVFSASTPSDFFSINNGVYFSGHDGDITVGSGNGYKTYLAWGSSGQSAHVINASGAIGLNTNLGTTPALSGTTNFGTSGQVLTSGGSSATPTWTSLSSTAVTSISFGTTGLTPATATTGSVAVAGTLVVGNGGTGVATLSGLAYGNGTSAFTAATAAQVVTVIGSTAVTNATNAANLTLAAGSGATNYITFSSTATGSVAQYTNTSLTYNYTNNAITGGIQGGGF